MVTLNIKKSTETLIQSWSCCWCLTCCSDDDGTEDEDDADDDASDSSKVKFVQSVKKNTIYCQTLFASHQRDGEHIVTLNRSDHKHHHHHNHFTALFPRPPGWVGARRNFWTLWCKGRLTEADTLTIWLGNTPSGLTSAHLHHPHFTGWMPFLLPNQHCQSTEGNYRNGHKQL